MAAGILGTQVIILTDKEIKQCVEFSRKSAPTQQSIEFGNRTTSSRRVAEVAFARFLEQNFKIHTRLDFNVYPRGKWDKEDIQLFGQPVDIKATGKGRKWLLVELNKLEFRKCENHLSFCFVFATTGWIRERDKPTGQVMLEGFAMLKEICNPEKVRVRSPEICEGIFCTQYLSAGSPIPGTRTPLQADNCARQVSRLHKNWMELIKSVPRRKSNDY